MVATTTEITTESMTSLMAYMHRPDVVQEFADVVGNDRRAMLCIQSILILVQNDPNTGEYCLQNCSPQSIKRAALRAVTLRASVDPALRQAWIVPRKNGKTGKVEACFQLHYAEVRNRAMRTGRYLYINVSPVYYGETVFENIYTGLHQVQLASGTMTQPTPVDFSDGWVPVGSRVGNVIGWLGYSETVKGAKQTVYMTIGDIEKHIKGINSWGLDTKAWKNEKSRQTMERKTVLLALLRKEDLADPSNENIKNVVEEAEADDQEQENGDFVDGKIVDGEAEYVFDDAAQAPATPAPAPVIVTPPAPMPSTPAPVTTPATPATPVVQAYGRPLKYSVAAEYMVWVDGKNMRLGDMTVDQLDAAENDPKRAESTKKAIRVVRNQKVTEAMEKEKKGHEDTNPRI